MDRRGAVRRIAGATAATCAGLVVGRNDVEASASDARPSDADGALSGRSDAGSVLKRSDVVFMYEAKADTYAAYGATVLAWGGEPTPASLAEAAGVAWHGSVGMVTEFGGYYDRFPQTWEAGLCRDVHGQPMQVPWLRDHRHQGVPFWWCCTRQPQFRDYLEARVAATLRKGAVGLHVDDHLGTSGALFLGACFCALCVAGFRAHVSALDAPARERLGIALPGTFDYGAVLRSWLADAPVGETRRVPSHPLWHEWSVYQLRSAAAYMGELRALAARVAGRPVPVSANAGLLWPNHLADYQAVDYFSAETDHDASSRRLNDKPLFACRMADALGRPYAATASGQDWAYVKEHGLTALVQGWIAASYAAGHRLMAPHRQWCYTEEKGTHWYDGPREAYAPLYRFVRERAALFDGHRAFGELVLVVPHRAWVDARDRWLAMGEALASANVSYRLAIASDDVVSHALAASDLAGVPVIVSPAGAQLLPADRAVVEAAAKAARVVTSVEEALALLRPAVRVEGGAPVRVHPRVSGDQVVLHVLNRAYDGARDAFERVSRVRLRLDREALRIARGVSRAAVFVPGRPDAELALGRNGELTLDLEGPWSIVRI